MSKGPDGDRQMLGASKGTQKAPQLATDALVRAEPDIANKGPVFNGRGRGNLNARPPAPKADFDRSRNRLVFNAFDFKEMARTH
jgi:hypothetical protein